jgi:hypothetical protein
MHGPGYSNENGKSGSFIDDFDFRQHLYDTIILLGGKKRIARLLIRSQDFHVSRSDIDRLRRYNGTLIDQHKGRLANINTIKVKNRPKSQ